MRCWPGIRRPILAWLVTAALVGYALTVAAGAGLSVRHASTRVVNDVYLVDALLDYQFSPDTLEALSNGIPLTFVLTVEIHRRRAYLWDASEIKVRQSYRLSYHALSNRYLITNLITGNRRSFHSLDDAIAGLGIVNGVPVAERHRLDPGQSYELRLRAQLDVEALPAPLRLVAYLSPQWRLSSGWYRWELEP